MKLKQTFTLKVIISILILGTNVAQAQMDFLKGFIITNDNDTIRGMLKEQFSYESYDLLFKKSENDSDVKRYTPLELSAYYLDINQFFESHNVPIGDSTQQVFLNCHIKGDISFYSFVDKNLVEHLYLKTDKRGIQKLIYEEYTRYDKKSKKRVIQRDRHYAGELKLAFQDCATLFDEIDELGFFRKSIQAMFRKYYDCKAKDYIEYKPSKKAKSKLWEFGVLLGGNRRIETDNGIESMKLGGNLNPFIRFTLPNSKNRYSIELRYNWSTIGFRDGRIKAQSVQFRFNQYFKKNINSVYPKIGVDFNTQNYDRNGLVLGMGYDLKINKLKLISNLEFRFLHNKIFNLNVGLGF